MCDAASGSTVFARVCGPVRGVPSSSGVASRAGGSSLPRNGRPFVSLRPATRFSTVYRTGTQGRVGGIKVIRAPGENGPPQVGIVASRRVGNAVRRNRAKRRIREALMKVELQRNTAYVVVASPGVDATEFGRLECWLEGAIADSTRRRIDE